jgi:hypothetical protein
MGPLALSRVASFGQQPAYGQVRVSNELKKRAMSALPAGVRTIWPGLDLQTFQQRLKALSANMMRQEMILIEIRSHLLKLGAGQ